jgi:hypothetical protein
MTEAPDTTSAEPPPKPWYRRWAVGKNRYDHLELAGAFGDLGTLIPFVVGYIAVMKVDPLGILFMLGLSQILGGLFYKTPMPVQPMKAIGGAAIASGGTMSLGMIFRAGGFAMWTMGTAFLTGVVLYQVLQRGWLKL